MTAFNIVNLMKNTKQMLCAYIVEQAAEINGLRAQISELSVQLQAERVGGNSQQPCEKCKEYASYLEAAENCRRLIAWDKDKRFVFTQRGNQVLCKPRMQ